jgi:LPS sulfotransferase NodH
MKEQDLDIVEAKSRRVEPAWVGSGRKTLFIASEARSGSTFIAETLAYELHAALGYDLWQLSQEPFQALNDRSTPEEALSTLAWLHLDKSGFAGAKVLCGHMAHLWRLASVSPAVRAAFFGPHAYWIVVRRKDLVDQAVSLAAARKSGVFHHYADVQAAPDREDPPKLEEIEAALKAIALSDVYLELWTRELPPERTVSLIYEDFLVDQVGALQRIHDLCQFPPLDVAAYANGAKLKRTESDAKRRASAAYKAWLLGNYF